MTFGGGAFTLDNSGVDGAICSNRVRGCRSLESVCVPKPTLSKASQHTDLVNTIVQLLGSIVRFGAI
eukprot:scaffold150490_cov29-Tisochrysis_lutea.AAC.2